MSDGAIGGRRRAERIWRAFMVILYAFVAAFAILALAAVGGSAEVAGPDALTATREMAFAGSAGRLSWYALAFGAAVLLAVGLLRVRRQ
jgi:hypothetical protein